VEGGAVAATSGRLGFRFAAGAPASVTSWRQLVDHASFLEDAGYSVATFPDHFFLPLAPLVALAGVAARTSRLRVGTLMLAASFRNPAVLAKELATADLVSEGRLEVGLGAGWIESEHAAAGLALGSPRDRIARVVEVAEILKAAWTSPSVSYEGAFYRLSDVPCSPAPVQAGGPPLFMGGGMRRVLTTAAQLADIVTILPGAIGVPGSSVADHPALLAERVAWVRNAAAQAGRSPEIHLLLSGAAVCGDRYEGAARCLDEQSEDTSASGDRRKEKQAILESPFYAIGTVKEICDQLIDLRSEYGVSYFSVREHMAREFAPVVAELAGT
jgi:probable F420-dependent oxidoreductase